MAEEASSTFSPTKMSGVPYTAGERYVQSGTLFIFFVMALIGNVIVVVKMAAQSRHAKAQRWTTVSLLCLNLGIADIIAAFCCILSNAIMYLLEEFVAGNAVCKVLKFLQRLGLAASTFIVVTISVDRYLAIRCPMRRKREHEGLCMVVIIWVLASLFSLPQMFVFEVSTQPINGQEAWQCAGFDETALPWQEFLYDLNLLLVLYVIPITVIVTCYSLILRRISVESHKGDQMLSCDGTPTAVAPREKLYRQARNTSLIMSLVVIFTFVFCWAPFYMALVVHLVTKPATFESYYYNHAIYFCGLGHSVLNPLFYGAFHIIRRARRDNESSRNRSSTVSSRHPTMDCSTSKYTSTFSRSMSQRL